MTPTSLKNLQEEIRVLSNLPASDHIIRLHETIKTKNHFYLIVDYCNGGDLESVLEHRLLLSEKEVQIIFRQVLKAIKVMRDLKVIHRDIKNANILLHFPNSDIVNRQ
jgi:serine/threonine protein kinase